MAEYSKPFGNVGEPGSACQAGRIPEEGAQRPTSLDWVLSAAFSRLLRILPEPGRRGQCFENTMAQISLILNASSLIGSVYLSHIVLCHSE